jgi:hypothetical protein
MRVEQHGYCGAEAMLLRRRDGTAPWAVHPCEVDSLGRVEVGDPIYLHWLAAATMRRQLEGVATTPSPTC